MHVVQVGLLFHSEIRPPVINYVNCMRIWERLVNPRLKLPVQTALVTALNERDGESMEGAARQEIWSGRCCCKLFFSSANQRASSHAGTHIAKPQSCQVSCDYSTYNIMHSDSCQRLLPGHTEILILHRMTLLVPSNCTDMLDPACILASRW